MYTVEHGLMHGPTDGMFADLVLDILPHWQRIKQDSFVTAHPFEASPDQTLDAPRELQLTVDRTLGLLRQVYVQGEDVHYEKLLAFVGALPLSKPNRVRFDWIAKVLECYCLPSAREVDLHLTDEAHPLGERSFLNASPRFVAALRLYGRLVHRHYRRRTYLGHLVRSLGEKFVFEYSGRYAEGAAAALIKLALLWFAHETGRDMGGSEHPNPECMYWSEELLVELKEFLVPRSSALVANDGRTWSAPF